MRNLSSLVCLLTLGLSMNASAIKQTIKLPTGQLHLRGSEKVNLKSFIARRSSRDLLRGWELDSVSLYAKSKKGNADLTVEAGYHESSPQEVPGTPELFDKRGEGFKLLSFSLPSYGDTEKRWALESRGNVKVKGITLNLEKKLKYDFSNVSSKRFKSQGDFKASKVLGSSKTVYPGPRISAIKLTCTKEKVSIGSINVKFEDGQEITITELRGKLKQGRSKAFKFAGALNKPISKITVNATSYGLFGSRGKLEVSTGK